MEADEELSLPMPRQLAESLMARAWDDNVADRERLLLEQAALAIQGLLVELAAVSEQAEARRTNVRR
jgi:hypothetical protein